MRKWLRGGENLDAHHHIRHRTHPWYLVIWLTGVDYFSTLGYQPGIALLAAGALSPVATTVLVAVTLFCALPIYTQVAGRSYVGQGSIAMLENLLPGWAGKILVLVLLGFAGTDFLITMTLSAADAATHATQNPYLHRFLGDAHMSITLGLLALLALVFLKGFTEAIELATAVCIPYLLLNVIVLVRVLFAALDHPTLFQDWKSALFRQHNDWTGLMLASLLVFPKLALGLSGFETGVSVMPLIRGAKTEEQDSDARPGERIRNTRKLLASAALIMSVLLIVSSFVTAAADTGEGVSRWRTCQRPRYRLPGARVSGQCVRKHVRYFDYFHPLVCRGIGYGGPAAPDSALSSAPRDGAALGGLLAPSGPAVVRFQCIHNAHFSRQCGSPRRRVRNWCSSFDVFRRNRSRDCRFGRNATISSLCTAGSSPRFLHTPPSPT